VSQALAAAVRLARRPADRDALREFEGLYRECRDDVYAYVATMVRDAATAEDVTATAFEKAYRRRGQFNSGRGTPRSWVFGIARNAALDELRRRKRHAALPLDPVDEVDPVAEPGEDPSRRAAVAAALAGLATRDREIVALKFGAGLSNGELGTVLGTSETNAGTLVHRAMSKLREACHVPA
jgi:RNA polymerase sigma factor (sigma-70 family)